MELARRHLEVVEAVKRSNPAEAGEVMYRNIADLADDVASALSRHLHKNEEVNSHG